MTSSQYCDKRWLFWHAKLCFKLANNICDIHGSIQTESRNYMFIAIDHRTYFFRIKVPWDGSSCFRLATLWTRIKKQGWHTGACPSVVLGYRTCAVWSGSARRSVPAACHLFPDSWPAPPPPCVPPASLFSAEQSRPRLPPPPDARHWHADCQRARTVCDY